MSQSLCKQIATVVKPTGQFSLDKQLRKFDGRSSNKITVPKKPVAVDILVIAQISFFLER